MGVGVGGGGCGVGGRQGVKAGGRGMGWEGGGGGGWRGGRRRVEGMGTTVGGLVVELNAAINFYSILNFRDVQNQHHSPAAAATKARLCACLRVRMR